MIVRDEENVISRCLKSVQGVADELIVVDTGSKDNTIAIANTEKLVAFQTASLQKYAQLGIAQWKAAAQVNDPESLVAYLTAQRARMTEVGEQVIADTKQAYQLGMDLLSEAQKVPQDNVASVTALTKEKAISRKAAA